MILLSLAAVALLSGGARYAYWSLIEHRFCTVTEGSVYQSGAMPPEVLLDEVRRHGIQTVIDLRDGPPELIQDERTALASAGVGYFNLPACQIPEGATVDAFLETMRTQPRPVLIHCKDGEGRSVLFSALYRIEFEGWNNERARRGTRWFSGWGNFKPGSAKGEYLRAYVPRGAGLKAPHPAGAPG